MDNIYLQDVGLRMFMKFNNILKAQKSKFDASIVKCDAWIVILLAVLLTIAFTVASALAVWCVVYRGLKFSGRWKWSVKGVSVLAECV